MHWKFCLVSDGRRRKCQNAALVVELYPTVRRSAQDAATCSAVNSGGSGEDPGRGRADVAWLEGRGFFRSFAAKKAK